MAIRFIYLEKACATIPRDTTLGTLTSVGVPEEGGQVGGGDV